MLVIFIWAVAAETEPIILNDVSSVNLSLYQPLLTGEKGIEVLKDIEVYIDDMKLESKVGSGGGSLRYVNPQVVLKVNNLSIENSLSTGNGGSFFMQSPFTLKVSNCSFLNSSAASHGGSVYAQTTNSVIITQSLCNKTRGQHGGSAYIYSGKCNITKSWFTNSEATQSGGSLFICGTSSNLFYQINDCFFGECKCADSGGAIYVSSPTNSLTEIIDCTFYSCYSSGGNGGAIYISTQGGSIYCNIKRICFSMCLIENTSPSLSGTSLYIISSSQDLLLSMEMITCSKSGKSGRSVGSISLYYGQQSAIGINLSFCLSKESSGFEFYPSTTASYQFLNVIQCSSNSNRICYLYPQSTGSVDLSNSNVLNNTGSSSVIRVYGYLNKFIIKNSVFYGNSGILFIIEYQTQIVRNSYIVHSGTLHSGFVFESCITTSSTSFLTQTHILTHYSTYLCPTPQELGILEIPCQTIPEGIYPVDCPTNPPAPTTCVIHTADAVYNIISMSSMFQLIISSLLNIL